MSQPLHPLVRALVLGTPIGLAVAPTVAEASLVVQSSADFSGTGSVSFSGAMGQIWTKTKDGITLATVGLSSFSPAMGVLTGAKVGTIDSSLILTENVTARAPNDTTTNEAFSMGHDILRLDVAGARAESGFFLTIARCQPTSPSLSCARSDLGQWPVTLAATVPGEALDAYVGESGTVLAKLSAPTFEVSGGDGVLSVGGTHTVTWEGQLDARYTYLDHAAPSFSKQAPVTSLTLDFGTLQPGESPTLRWEIAARGNADTVGLDFDGFSTSSPDAALFDLGLTAASLFRDLQPGSGRAFFASPNTSTPGTYEAHYTLYLSDADVGAAASRLDHTLNLTLKSVVIPLPPAWLLMASAAAGVFGWGRRQTMGRRRGG